MEIDMKTVALIILLLSLASVLGIAFSLGKCVEIYTGSTFYKLMFQWSFTFLSSFFVSHFIVQRYIKPLMSL
jgi:hypothetical protein